MSDVGEIEIVRSAELARLRQVEQAAREAMAATWPLLGMTAQFPGYHRAVESINALRVALAEPAGEENGE